MAHALPTADELRKMPAEELQREIRAHRTTLTKMRMDVHLKKEKDTARYRRERRHLARMLTALQSLERRKQPKDGAGSLKSKPKSRTISSPKAAA